MSSSVIAISGHPDWRRSRGARPAPTAPPASTDRHPTPGTGRAAARRSAAARTIRPTASSGTPPAPRPVHVRPDPARSHPSRRPLSAGFLPHTDSNTLRVYSPRHQSPGSRAPLGLPEHDLDRVQVAVRELARVGPLPALAGTQRSLDRPHPFKLRLGVEAIELGALA